MNRPIYELCAVNAHPVNLGVNAVANATTLRIWNTPFATDAES